MIEIRRPRLQIARLGFLWRSKELFNELPLQLRENSNYLSFKRQLRKHIINKRRKLLNADSSLDNTIVDSDDNTEDDMATDVPDSVSQHISSSRISLN